MTTFKIPPPRITEFINDIKRLNVRHKPFSAYIPQGYYEIELYPNPNELFKNKVQIIGQMPTLQVGMFPV